MAQFNSCNNGGDYGDWANANSPAQDQDAFGTPGTTPTLTRNSPEVVALDAIGYNLAPVPEPTSLVLFGSVAALAAVMTTFQVFPGQATKPRLLRHRHQFRQFQPMPGLRNDLSGRIWLA